MKAKVTGRTLTFSDDFKKLNPQHFGMGGLAAHQPEQKATPEQPPEKFKLNKTEQRWFLHLQALRCGKIMHGESWSEIHAQAITIELGEGCRYRPDFAAVVNGKLTFWETKGAFVRDAGKVKYKVAPRIWPEFDFYLAQWKGGKWTETKLLP
jgi:hypothetical protein